MCDVAGIVGVAEAIYQNADSVDLRITVVGCEDNTVADEFVNQYKLSLPPLARETQFAEESFNGHFATRIMDHTTVGGEQVARNAYMWSNDNFVFIVNGNTEKFTQTRALAETTGQ